MKPSDVVEIIADLEDAYREFSPEKKRLYAKELAGLDVTSARAAVRALIRRSRWLPTIAEIRQEERDERGIHPDVPELGYERLALPSPEEFAQTLAQAVAENPELGEQWERMKARITVPVRRYPAALDSVPDEDLDKPKFILRRDMICDGFGKAPVKIDGVLCCPGCKEPLP